MKISISIAWEIYNKKQITIIDDQVDSFDINAPTEEIRGYQKTWTVGFETVVVLDTFLLFEAGVDADWVEQFLC